MTSAVRMRRLSRRTELLVLGLTLVMAVGLAAPGAADEKRQTFGLDDPRGTFSPDKALRGAPSAELGVTLDAVSQVVLGPVDTEALLLEDEAKARIAGNKVLRFGVGRDVDVRTADGNWYQLADGSRLWVLDVVSAGAIGLRLHFADVRLPEGSRLAVYAPEEESAAKAAGPVQRRIDLYDAAAAEPREEFWTGTTFGEAARIEYHAPQGAGEELPFRIDRLQHLYVDPVQALSKAAGPCHNDVTCHPGWENVARAVAGIGIIDFDSLFCTGQLINNFSQDFTPYWLTANHCLDSNFEAQDSEIFWFYQTASCGGAPPSISSLPTSRGATLVATHPASDFTLLLIDGALPNGVFWAGWTAADVGNGAPVTAIHHPSGDFKRISFGSKDSTTGCGGSDHIRVNWSDGPTEPGSSGSGIFLSETQQLIGQLHCGPSACGNETNDDYGAFFSTFNRIRNQLNGGSDDNSEPNDTCGKPRTVRSGNNLTNRIVKWADTDWYKIRVPKNKTLTVTLTFSHEDGDIDARLHRSCGQEPVAEAAGTSDTEVLTYKNTGATANFIFEVFLASDTRNSYTMKVGIKSRR